MNSPEIKKILNRHWGILQTDPLVGHTLTPHPQVTFRRNTNLRDLLVHSHFKKPQKKSSTLSTLKGFFPCRACKACKGSRKISQYLLPGSTQPMPIKKYMTCNTDHVVYCITCPCKKTYIGSTTKKAKCRILEHMRAISNKDFSYPVSRHFAENHKSDRGQLQFFCLDTVDKMFRGGDRVKKLRRLESRYIIALDSKFPIGLNMAEELISHL